MASKAAGIAINACDAWNKGVVMQKVMVSRLFCLGVFIGGFVYLEGGSDLWYLSLLPAMAVSVLLMSSDPDQYLVIPSHMPATLYRGLSVMFMLASIWLSISIKLYSVLGLSMVFLAMAIYPSEGNNKEA